MAVLTNTPSDTSDAYYDIWIKIFKLDFFSIYPSSFTEGQGSIEWKNSHFVLEEMEQATDWVKSTQPTSEIGNRSDNVYWLVNVD